MSYVDPNIQAPSRPSVRQGLDSRELVAQRLRARRHRVRLVRKRVVATGGAIFALAWGVIFVQLVSGHDPALSHGKTRTSASSTSSGGTSSGSGSSGLTGSSGSTGSGSAGSQASSPGSATPSTTSQS